MPGPSRNPAAAITDDDGKQRADRHAPADRESVRPRDHRAQKVGQRGREEHGQGQASGQPGEREEAAPDEEPTRLHDGPAVSGPRPDSVASTGVRRA